MSATKPSVIEAITAVMGDVQAVKKGDRNTQQGYNFRGVDAVVNAVGPALRKHGVIVLPIGAVYESEHYQTAKGTPMKGTTVTVTFRFYGPAGDFVDAQVCGESADTGDKAMPKAHSVAYRTLLLQALCIPTDEADPDSQSHERAPQKKEPAKREFRPPPNLATPPSKREFKPASLDTGAVAPAIEAAEFAQLKAQLLTLGDQLERRKEFEAALAQHDGQVVWVRNQILRAEAAVEKKKAAA